MAKCIRRKLARELKAFDPKLLAKECMFEEEEAGSGLETSESYLSDSVVEERRRKDKTAGAKPLEPEVEQVQASMAKVAAAGEPEAPRSMEVGLGVEEKA